MHGDCWKWILDTIPDEDLFDLAKGAKITLPGFRPATWAKKSAIVRPRLVQVLLGQDGLFHLRRAFNGVALKKPEIEAFRDMSENELWNAFQDQDKVLPALISLLSSIEPEHEALGLRLFERLQAEGLLPTGQGKPTKQPASEAQESPELADLKAERDELQKKLQKSERELKTLQNTLKKAQTEAEKAQKKWEQERQRLLGELSAKDRQVGSLQSELIETKTSYEQVIQEQQLALAIAEGAKTLPEANVIEDTPVTSTDKRIILVGSLPKTGPRLNSKGVEEIAQIAATDIERALDDDLVAHAEQVWLLQYDVPLQIKRKVSRAVSQSKLVKFDTYHQLVMHLRQEGLA